MTTVTRQIHFAVKGHRKVAKPGPAPKPKPPVGRTPRVAKLMALAIRFDQLLQEGKVADQSELARLAHVTQPRMTQIMNLLHLAPDIQEDLLFWPPTITGRDTLSEKHMRQIVREVNWMRQRRRWQQIRARQPRGRTASCCSLQSGAASTEDGARGLQSSCVEALNVR